MGEGMIPYWQHWTHLTSSETQRLRAPPHPHPQPRHSHADGGKLKLQTATTPSLSPSPFPHALPCHNTDAAPPQSWKHTAVPPTVCPRLNWSTRVQNPRLLSSIRQIKLKLKHHRQTRSTWKHQLNDTQPNTSKRNIFIYICIYSLSKEIWN